MNGIEEKKQMHSLYCTGLSLGSYNNTATTMALHYQRIQQFFNTLNTRMEKNNNVLML